MNFVKKLEKSLVANLEKNNQTLKIVFPEGENQLVQFAAHFLIGLKNIEPVLLVSESYKNPNQEFSKYFHKITKSEIKRIGKIIFDLKKGKYTEKEAEEFASKSNYFAAAMVANNEVDCFLGGIDYPSSEIMRAAFRMIGPKTKLAFSTMLIEKSNSLFLFTDPSVVPNPDSEQLAEMAIVSAEFARDIIEMKEVNLGLLSFSTNGSSNTPEVLKVRKAKEILDSKKLDFNYDGEIQFDAAVNKQVRNKKFKNSNLKNNVKVFIFPNLDSANIGMKIAQRLGGYDGAGPILLNMNGAINDLSRGATSKEIYDTALITLKQALVLKMKKM